MLVQSCSICFIIKTVAILYYNLIPRDSFYYKTNSICFVIKTYKLVCYNLYYHFKMLFQKILFYKISYDLYRYARALLYIIYFHKNIIPKKYRKIPMFCPYNDALRKIPIYFNMPSDFSNNYPPKISCSNYAPILFKLEN